VTLTLRRVGPDDAPFLDECIGTVSDGGYEIDEPSGVALLRHIASIGADARLIGQDGEPCGVVAWRTLDGDRRAFEFVAVSRAQTRRGLGRAAAELAEAEMRRTGARTVYAPASEKHGIAVYFWIRLGYRPLLRGGWPCARDGVAWLSRTLDDR
jgi:GNAT superfamily N-acetyltransferase